MPVLYSVGTLRGFKRTILLDEATDILLPTTEKIVGVVPAILSEFLDVVSDRKTVFDSDFSERLTILEYLTRINGHFMCSNDAYVIALIYMDRVPLCKNFPINRNNVYLIFLTCLVLAVKFIDDHYMSNAKYARGGYCTLKALNRMEQKLLGVLNYNLHVLPPEFIRFRNYLHVAAYKIP
eukprot:Platyproteum_vivax@DN5070_c0_g1_i1.p1